MVDWKRMYMEDILELLNSLSDFSWCSLLSSALHPNIIFVQRGQVYLEVRGKVSVVSSLLMLCRVCGLCSCYQVLQPASLYTKSTHRCQQPCYFYGVSDSFSFWPTDFLKFFLHSIPPKYFQNVLLRLKIYHNTQL